MRICIAQSAILTSMTVGMKRLPIRSKHFKKAGGSTHICAIESTTCSILRASKISRLVQKIRKNCFVTIDGFSPQFVFSLEQMDGLQNDVVQAAKSTISWSDCLDCICAAHSSVFRRFGATKEVAEDRVLITWFPWTSKLIFE